jgi:hypothetical protein
VQRRLEAVFPKRYQVLGNASGSARSGVALVWRRDAWDLVSAFSLWGVQRRAMGAVLRDREGQEWGVFVVHFPNSPGQQTTMWKRLVQAREHMGGRPIIILADFNSILDAVWDDAGSFVRGTPQEESQNIVRARAFERSTMMHLGLEDAWRRLFEDPEEVTGVGATRENRRIDRVLLSTEVVGAVGGMYRVSVGGGRPPWGGGQANAGGTVPEE